MSKKTSISNALEVARKYASGGRVGYADGGDVDTSQILNEMDYRRARERPLGLPEPLKGTIHDAQMQEGAFADDGRERSIPAMLDMILSGGRLGAELTGVPGMVRGYGNIREGIEKGDPVLGAAGASQFAVGAIPAAATLKTGARALSHLTDGTLRSGLFGASLGVPNAVLESRAARAGALDDQIIQKLRGMSPEQIMDYQRAIGATPDGKVGRDTLSKALAYEAKIEAANSAAAKDAEERVKTERMLGMERAKGDAAAAVEAAKIKAEAEAKSSAEARKRDQQAKLPIRELYPEYMPWLPVLAGGVAGITGGAIKSSYAQKYNKTVDDLVGRWEKAVKGSDPALSAALKARVDAARGAGPGGTWPALGVGAIEGGLIGLLPEEIDVARNVPGAWERMTDLPAISKRGGIGALIGAGSAGLGAAKSAASARKSENIKDFGPETDVMRGVGQKDITTADNLAAYNTAVQAARTRSGKAQLKADKDLAIGDAKTRSAISEADLTASAAESDAIETALRLARSRSEAQRRISGPEAGQGPQSGGTQRPPRSGESAPTSSSSNVPSENSVVVASSPERTQMQEFASAIADGVSRRDEQMVGVLKSLTEAVSAGNSQYGELLKAVTDRMAKAPVSRKTAADRLAESPATLEAEAAKRARAKRAFGNLIKSPEKASGGPVTPTVFLKTKHPSGHWQMRSTNGKFASGGAVSAALDTARRYASGGRVHVGPVVGATGGREDKLPVSVPAGSFVIPADVVGSLGQGNTGGGFAKLEKMFGKPMASKAAGGAIPIKISDGEFVISPEQVAKIGDGDMDRGHRTLDALVMKLRDEHIKTLAALPPPSK